MSTSVSFTVRPPPNGSSANGSSSRPNGTGSRQTSRLGPPSRRMFEDADSGSEDEHAGFGRKSRDANGGTGGRSRDERVDGFSNGKARSSDARPKAKDGPLVIPALPNKDWRESSRRVPTYRPEVRQQEGEAVTHERTGDGPQRSGLRRIKKGVKQEDKEDVKPDTAALDAHPNGTSASTNGHHTTQDVKPVVETLEQQALRELLAGQPSSPTAAERAQREMVIAMESNRVLSESEALRRDIGSLPEESTMEDFEAVPISAFGIAALRGMGWDPKSTENVKAREVTRRPQLLGLGATPMKAEIMPTHKKGDKGKGKREERGGRGYNAAGLMIKQAREGREGSANGTANGSERAADSGRDTPVLARASRGTSVESDGSRRRKRDDDDGRDVKRRDGRDERDYRDRERERDRGRDRDRDRDRNGRRYETEEERARRKAKERERERDRDDKDRYREREREKVRDRDGDRRRDDRDRYREKESSRDYDRDRRDRDRDDRRR